MVSIHKILSGSLVFGPFYDTVASPELSAADQLNIVRYLGGSGPYIQNPGYGISAEIPENCKIEQVQLMSRHGERFPGLGSGKSMKELVDRLQNFKKSEGKSFVGSLSFLNTYKYYASSEDLYEEENTHRNSPGPYLGSETCRRMGKWFRKKYGSLYDDTAVLPVFVAGSKRVYDSAVYFTQGFNSAGAYKQKKYKFNVITENISQGFNTLVPRSNCPAFDYDWNAEELSRGGDATIRQYRNKIHARLVKDHEGLDLKVEDVDKLFEMCAFELNYQGYSSFCSIFTEDDFIAYGYNSDLRYYYSSGPGGKLTKEIGSIPLKASLKLLKETAQENSNKIWLSFTHDTDIEIFHAALGLFDTMSPLPVDKFEFRDVYHHSSVVPMGGRTVTEKYTCDGESEPFVRFIVNDAVIPIKSCADGPGYSCKLSDFEKYVESRMEGVDIGKCSPSADAPSELTFYWDYQEHSYNDEALRINP